MPVRRIPPGSLVLLSFAVLSMPLVAQTTASPDTPEPVAGHVPETAKTDLEEILVTAERSIVAIRSQIAREEMRSYKMFNELNSDDDFDITCRQVRANSHIAKRECEPRFFTRERHGNSIMALADIREGLIGLGDGEEAGFDLVQLERGASSLASDQELKAQEQDRFEQLNEEMLRIALEHPEYRESLLRLNTLKAVLQQKRDQRFKN